MVRYFVGAINPLDGKPFKMYINTKDKKEALRIAECFVGEQAKEHLYFENDEEGNDNE